MRFTRYGKFNGLDVWSLDLGDLMEGLSDSLLSSGFDDDYYWTRERTPRDTTLDALRRALLQALIDQGMLSEHQIKQMLDENEGKYEGSQLQEMLPTDCSWKSVYRSDPTLLRRWRRGCRTRQRRCCRHGYRSKRPGNSYRSRLSLVKIERGTRQPQSPARDPQSGRWRVEMQPHL